MKEKTKEKMRQLTKSQSGWRGVTLSLSIDTIIYILHADGMRQIKWREFENMLEKLVKNNWNTKKETYEIFRGCFSSGPGPMGGTMGRWEDYFVARPGLLNLSMGQGPIPSMDGPIFKAHDWPQFKNLIEKRLSTSFIDLEKIFEIADDLLKELKK